MSTVVCICSISTSTLAQRALELLAASDVTSLHKSITADDPGMTSVFVHG